MPRKWNRIVVEEDAGVIEVYSNGRMMAGLNIAACDEDIEQVRQGYRCLSCWEPFDTTFPEQCFVCGFPCKDKQAEQFAKVYKGYDPTLRTGADWEKEADSLQEAQERRAFEERAGKSGISLGMKGVLIPKGIK